MVIRFSKFTVRHHHLIDQVTRLNSLHHDTAVDMFESAMCDRNILSPAPDSNTGWINVFLQPELLRIQPWDLCQIPGHIGKSKCQTTDHNVTLSCQVNQRGFFSSLDNGRVGVLSVWQNKM